MLTKAQAQIVREAIGDAAHSVRTEFYGPNQYTVRGVDRATGYPFTVADFDTWQERRAANAQAQVWAERFSEDGAEEDR